jgi:uncharacterized protein
MFEDGPLRRDADPSFVPLERLRRNEPDPGGALVGALKGRLGELAARLEPGERDALAALLKSLEARNPHLLELAALPPEAVLSPAEAEIYRALPAVSPNPASRLPSAVCLIVKGTRLCNLRCTYCRSWAEGPDQVMPFNVLARTIQTACTSPGAEQVEFIWHGGETTLRPISFYRKALWLQEQLRPAHLRISNQIQTNGTKLTPEWLRFLKQHRFSVGVSLDGPPEVHDRRRLDVKGRPTSHRVRQGIAELSRHRVPFAVSMVVDEEVRQLGARRVLDYFLELGVSGVSLLNVVPDGEPERELPGDFLAFPSYVRFLQDLFQLWWPEFADRISFREISDLMHRLERGQGNFCVFGENCMSHIYTIEPQGGIAACDRFQGDSAFSYGNVLDTELSDLVASANFRRAQAETDAEMDATRHCPWFSICHGGCPHDRYVRVHRGVSGDESCCGWAPLLADLASALGERNQPGAIP